MHICKSCWNIMETNSSAIWIYCCLNLSRYFYMRHPFPPSLNHALTLVGLDGGRLVRCSLENLNHFIRGGNL